MLMGDENRVMDATHSLCVRLYRRMFLIRRTEEILMAEYHPADEMRCPMHFCVGQEAMPAALGEIVRRDDVLMSHYRSHGYYLAKGAPLEAMIAEFYGKESGSNRGVAGSMELGSHEYNYFSGAVVGGSVVIPLGSAFAQKYRGSDAISVAVFGDGSFDEGITYEVFNLAALHRLPLLFICENNRYAAHTPLERRMAATLLSQRAQAFGLPAEKLDGNDAELLVGRLETLVPAMRAGGGPHFMEIETYRHCAHVGPDNDDALAYRPAPEVKEWMARDPLVCLRDRVQEIIGAAALAAMHKEIDSTINAAVRLARAANFPDYAKTIATNWSGGYSAAVKKFINNPSELFDSAQPEARPGPF
jgi:TPP-dependent pyruvate/acetoin dehydrogenase alpha subunit